MAAHELSEPPWLLRGWEQALRRTDFHPKRHQSSHNLHVTSRHAGCLCHPGSRRFPGGTQRGQVTHQRSHSKQMPPPGSRPSAAGPHPVPELRCHTAQTAGEERLRVGTGRPQSGSSRNDRYRRARPFRSQAHAVPQNTAAMHLSKYLCPNVHSGLFTAAQKAETTPFDKGSNKTRSGRTTEYYPATKKDGNTDPCQTRLALANGTPREGSKSQSDTARDPTHMTRCLQRLSQQKWKADERLSGAGGEGGGSDC